MPEGGAVTEARFRQESRVLAEASQNAGPRRSYLLTLIFSI